MIRYNVLTFTRLKDKNELNYLEQRFNNDIASILAEYNDIQFKSPKDLHDVFHNMLELTFQEEVNQGKGPYSESPLNNLPLLKHIHNDYNEKVNDMTAQALQKENFHHKINEEIIYLLLMNRYFKVIASVYEFQATDNALSLNLVGEDPWTSLGLVISPLEISELLGYLEVNYNDYLLALLRLVETILTYTTNATILISIDPNITETIVKQQYSLSLVNLKLIGRLQDGFQSLDLKNDNIRRRYDGLKYSLKKVNGVVYDLSLRNLITIEVTLV